MSQAHTQVPITHHLFTDHLDHLYVDELIHSLLTPLWNNDILTFFSCQNVAEVQAPDLLAHWYCAACNPTSNPNVGYVVVEASTLARALALISSPLHPHSGGDCYTALGRTLIPIHFTTPPHYPHYPPLPTDLTPSHTYATIIP